MALVGHTCPQVRLRVDAMTMSDYLTVADYFALAIIVALGGWAVYIFTRRRR
jgi:hypothetical protein